LNDCVKPHELRFACAEALLRERHAAADRGWPAVEWSKRTNAFLSQAGGKSAESLAIEGLLLVGPEWLSALSEAKKKAVRRQVYGNPTFDPILYDGVCESLRLWGYQCPFVTAAMAADHLFPRALGGITDPRNRLTLCTWHNTAKSMDVHVFPWEEGVPQWVPQTISALAPWIQNV
jgi:hypothetical protein